MQLGDPARRQSELNGGAWDPESVAVATAEVTVAIRVIARERVVISGTKVHGISASVVRGELLLKTL
jgi:hypothetical protein